MTTLLPGTQVRARGLRGTELDLLSPFETITPVGRELEGVTKGMRYVRLRGAGG